MSDSYDMFLETFNIDRKDIIKFGLEKSIYIKDEVANKNWNELKNKINKREKIYIRGYGRDAKGTFIFSNLYKYVYGIEIIKDPTNNSKPQKLIQDLTGLKRNRDIHNYQVSHVFGRTKNPYCFLAPWNIVYVPKVIDPFTGHESKGKLSDIYKFEFKNYVYEKYKDMILEFNEMMSIPDTLDKVKEYTELLKNVEVYEEYFKCSTVLKNYYGDSIEKKFNKIKMDIIKEFELIK